MLQPSELLADGLRVQARSYQCDDADRALGILDHYRAVLLAHEPGLGKTLITLLLAAKLKAKRILIVCPAVARLVWENEIVKWVPEWRRRLCILSPGEHIPDLARRLAAPDVIVVASYDFIGSVQVASDIELDDTLFGKAAFDLLICDEAHYLKSPGACRTQRIYGDKGIALRADKAVLLTGTPAPNGPHELWTHLRAFWPDLILINSHHGVRRPMTEQEWSERVCKFKYSQWGRTFVGVKNTNLVRDKLAPIMIRRTKREVLPELPPVIARDVPLELSIHALWDRLSPEARRAYAKLTASVRRKPDAASILNALHPIDPDNAGALATMRRQLSEIKVQPTIEWAAPRLDANPETKMAIFGWHVAALERLHKRLAQYGPVILTGLTNDADRKKAIQKFQEDPDCHVFVGQLMACGTAVTLTAGNEAVFLECAWTPGVNTQAIGRLHRMGQKDSVLASFLYVPNTVDETVMGVFRRKASQLREFIRE